MIKKLISKKYMWDFSEIFSTQEEFEKAVRQLKIAAKKIQDFKGKISKADASTYLKFYDTTRKKNELYWKIIIYAQKYDSQMNDKQAMENRSIVSQMKQKLATDETWVSSELRKLGEKKILSFIKSNKEHAYLEKSVKEYFRKDNHHLKDNDEKFTANFVNLFSSVEKIYTQMAFADKKFLKIKYKGINLKLTGGLYGHIMAKSHVVKDQDLRQKAGHLWNKAFADNANSYAELYSTLVTTNMTLAKIKGYKSALHAGLDNENLPEEVYLNFIKNAEDHLSLLRDYYLVHKRELQKKGAKKYFDTDSTLPIIPLGWRDLKFTVNRGRKVCLEALKPLGKEFNKHLQEAIKFGRIDYHEREGKTGGGYSMATPYTNSYILMNWTNDYGSVNTLVHELGHSTHSAISNLNNKVEYASYSVLIAEVASTFCELLLNDYLVKKYEKNIAAKAYLLQESIGALSSLYFMTAKEASFEYQANQAAFEGKPTDKLFLQELVKSLEPKEKIFDEPRKEHYANNLYLSWPATAHHYTTFFYLYKYALSVVVSCNLYIDFVKTGDPTKFINLLKSGRTDQPLELVKKYAGVDLTDIKSHDKFFEVFENKVKQFRNIFK